MANGITIFAGPIYFSVCKKTGKAISIFNVFSENEVSLHIFMAAFVKDRNYFRYDTFFPHYTVTEGRRDEIIEAGAIETDKKGEEECIHNWHIKVIENRFM